MSLLSLQTFAQKDFLREPDLNKPLLFADMPTVLTVEAMDLDNLLNLSSSASASIELNGQFVYKGIVNSVTSENDNKLFTVIIRSDNRPGSFLRLSRITADDGSISYSARILSFTHGDCLVLKKNKDNSYVFEKKKFYDVVSE